METKHWFALAVVAVAGAEVAACSSKFSSCEASRSCPAGGTSGGGEAGEAGDVDNDAGRGGSALGAGASGASAGKSSAGGSGAGDADADAGASSADAGAGGAAPMSCSQDSDCSDHLACNGVEICHAGICEAGVSPCANPEPEHCDVVCVEKSGAASCTVRGQDQDHDGHFTAACTARRGDDCDDSTANVYSGAPELCDGIDNDCDKLVDLNDGLPVGGSTVDIGPSAELPSLPAIAWATDTSVYGIVFRDTTTSADADVYFEEVSQNGHLVLARKAINNSEQRIGGGYGNVGLTLTWGGDRFGAAWTGAAGFWFEDFGSNGEAKNPAQHVPNGNEVPVDEPHISRLTGGTWGAFFSEVALGYSYRAATIAPPAAAHIGANPRFGATSVAAVGLGFAVGATGFENGPEVAMVDLWDSAVASSQRLVTFAGRTPKLAAGANGLGVAVGGTSDTDAPRFYALANNGNVQCGPIPFADASFIPTAITATSSGYVIVSSGKVQAQEVSTDCKLGTLATIDPGPATNVHIAAGVAGYGIVWQDTTSSVPKRRLIGARWCD